MHKKGFTILEVTIVSGLMAFLSMLIASTWAGMGRPTGYLIRRGQCMQEMELVIATLAHDLGGYQADYSNTVDSVSQPGTKKGGRFTGWVAGSSSLQLTFYDETDLKDYSITYSLDTVHNLLKRTKSKDNTSYTVARNITAFTVTDYTSYIQIDLTFQYTVSGKAFSRSCTLQAKKPPLSSM
jgi:type II secretory pathway pseudopilin PulG